MNPVFHGFLAFTSERMTPLLREIFSQTSIPLHVCKDRKSISLPFLGYFHQPSETHLCLSASCGTLNFSLPLAFSDLYRSVYMLWNHPLVGPFSLSVERRMLWPFMNSGRETHPLREKELDILSELLKFSEDGLPSETILKKVWDYGPDIKTHTLISHIHTLRKKIEIDPHHAEILVKTTSGYRLIPPPIRNAL